MDIDFSLPALPPGLKPDPILVMMYRDPRLIQRIDLYRKILMSILEPDREMIVQELKQTFGQQETMHVLAIVHEKLSRPATKKPSAAEEVGLYQKYLRAYNRFGGVQRLLSFDEVDVLKTILALGEAAKVMGRPLSEDERARVETARLLLISHAPLMQGLLPENRPPEPAPLQLSAESLRHIKKVVSA
ncbi:MAG: hypothetical protein AAFV53_36070 [Myxococcota bacterium]